MEEWYKRNGNYDSRAATPSSGIFRNSTFSNCLFARNWRPGFKSCIFGNCTVAGNYSTKLSGCKAYNTVFHGVSKSRFAKKNKNTLSGCYKGTSPKFILTPVSRKWDDDGQGAFVGEDCWNWDSSAKLWVMQDATDADYLLRKDSPCIDKGLRGKTARKLHGPKDLNGKKRVAGKTVDIGCYEYSANQKGSVRFMNDMVVKMPDHGVCGWSDWALSSLKRYSDSETYGTLPIPECDGDFVFAGWWTDPIGGEQVHDSSPVTTRRLFAHWVEFCVSDYDLWGEETCSVSIDAYYAYRAKQDADSFQQSIGLFSLVVPATVNGLHVKAFWLRDATRPHVTSVTIPKTVSGVGWNPFDDCTALKTIRLQNGSPLVPGTDFEVPAGCTVVRY